MTIPRIGKKLCIYEGEVSEYCKTCSGTKAEDRHVRYCMHPSPSDIDRDFCTRGVVNDKVQSCSNCPDYCTEQLTLTHLSNFVSDFRNQVRVTKSIPYPADRFSGRGIVIPAGGWNQLPGIYLTASMLRWDHINSKLPIEVWYIGDNGEFDPLFAHITKGLDVTWRNISEEIKQRGIYLPEKLYGWAIKPLALLLSSFEEVVMLDSDCYPAYDPDILCNDPRIKTKSAAFWNDNPTHSAGAPLRPNNWSLFGMESPKESIPGFESGQMIVNKRKSWHAVQVAGWLAGRMNKFDATRGAKNGVHGDKEIFSVAWRATNTDYWMAPPVRFQEVAFLQHGPDNQVAFVHRCNDKPRIQFQDLKYSTQKFKFQQFHSTTLPHEHMVHHYLLKLRNLIRPNISGFRDDTQDQQIWNEIGIANTYQLPERMDGQTVLDIGGHIGLFTLQCLERGASKVICVEPYRANYELLQKNLAAWGKQIELYTDAIGSANTEHKFISGSCNGAEFTGEPHLSDSGIPVNIVTLDSLIDRAGCVDFLKLDCEGAEYDAILNCTKLACVKRIALEWHTNGLKHRPIELKDYLESNGFTVSGDTTGNIGMLFAFNNQEN